MKGSTCYVEGKVLMKCLVIVEAYTEKPKRTRQMVQSVLKKFGFGLSHPLSSLMLYIPNSHSAATVEAFVDEL